MFTLYHHPLSAASRAIRLLLAEYDVPFTLEEERVFEARDAFLDLNPAGTLPVLVAEGQRPVIGATPIAEFIDETIGTMQRDRRLYPESAASRAEMRRLVDWALLKLEDDVTGPVVHERYTKRVLPSAQGGGAPDSASLRRARTAVDFHLRYFAWLAENRDWLAGRSMTFADVSAAAAFSVLDYLGEIEWNNQGDLRDWYARLKSRPSFRPLLADRLRNMPPVSHYVDLDF